MRNIVFGFVLVVAFCLTPNLTSAQQSCNCSSTLGGCSASQSCPSGFEAICTCSSSGCSSRCSRLLPILENLTYEIPDLSNLSSKHITKSLSNAFGRNITFAAGKAGFQYSFSAKGSYWDVFDYLEKNGTLAIDGQPLEILRASHKDLVNGEPFTICAGGARVSTIVNHIAFLYGTKLLISGDPNTEFTASVTGKGIDDLLTKISEKTSVTITR